MNSNNIEQAQDLINNLVNKKIIVKRIKKDHDLLERQENDKIILVEDNRQVLLG